MTGAKAATDHPMRVPLTKKAAGLLLILLGGAGVSVFIMLFPLLCVPFVCLIQLGAQTFRGPLPDTPIDEPWIPVAIRSDKPRGKSYNAIGSLIIFGITSALIVAFYAANCGATHKMAGFEGIIVFPVAMLIYGTGLVLAALGVEDGRRRRMSFAGCVLNGFPWLCFAAAVLAAFLAHIYSSGRSFG